MEIRILRTEEGKIRVEIPRGIIKEEENGRIRVFGTETVEFDAEFFRLLKKLIEYAKKQGLI